MRDVRARPVEADRHRNLAPEADSPWMLDWSVQFAGPPRRPSWPGLLALAVKSASTIVWPMPPSASRRRAGQYVYDQAWEGERARLRALEATFDGISQQRLERLGVGPAWRCLEVGGGAGSIARWLAAQVGAAGRVVVTDLDTRFLHDLPSPLVEVRRHDIVTDELEARAFDLVHVRAVLEYVSDRKSAVAHLVQSLRPGGWLVLEGLDIGEVASRALERYTAPAALAPPLTKALDGFAALVRVGGGDAQCASGFPGLLVDAGLDDVDAECTSRLVRGGSPPAAFYLLSLRQLKPKLAATGHVSDAEVDAVIAHLEHPSSLVMSMASVCALGRRPAGPS